MGNIVKNCMNKAAEKATDELFKQICDTVSSGIKDMLSSDNKTKDIHKLQEDELDKYRNILSNYKSQIETYEVELNIKGLSEDRKLEIECKLKTLKENKIAVEEEYKRQLKIFRMENEYQESKNKSLNIPAVVGVGVVTVLSTATGVLLLKKHKSSDTNYVEDSNILNIEDDIIQG